jgi:molecular chaperone DnaK
VIEARNHADALIHSTEKTLKEHGEKIGAGERQAIETAIADLRTAMQGDDVDAIRSRTEALAQASMRLGEAMYRAGQAADEAGPGNGAAAGAPDGQAGQEGVVDADFEEVDENRKGRSP